ncbi:MAG: hypothetical protein N5P05_003798 [Chroococcopsis gigantea SAG 12.99]|jgi:glycosyltransferase involved in cell wall biosynthesis|nr:glycosyltransferase [Chlorogloea purpurea SAG 13.99]MDV3002192.1 hypothetical protein [Chroococcopsis gigantea SAG 12.99]
MDKSFPITILMPLKNYYLKYLEKSLNSVFYQTSYNWELLIIIEEDDKKNFQEILQSYLIDSRINLIDNKGCKLAGAINTGMKKASTEFVTILLGDDMLAKNAIEVLQKEIVENPLVDFFHSSRLMIDEEDRPISSIYYSRENFSAADFLDGSPVKHLLCWRRIKALSFGGLDESLNSVGPDDYDFPWTMLEQGARFKAIKDCLYFYRDHRDSFRLTTHLTLDTHVGEITRILKKHGIDDDTINGYIAKSKQSFLRQCLYKSDLDKWLKEKIGFKPKWGWREPYQ